MLLYIEGPLTRSSVTLAGSGLANGPGVHGDARSYVALRMTWPVKEVVDIGQFPSPPRHPGKATVWPFRNGSFLGTSEHRERTDEGIEVCGQVRMWLTNNRRHEQWMEKWRVLPFFDYLNGKGNSYWTDIPKGNDPTRFPEREAITVEQDKALRALLPDNVSGSRTKARSEARSSTPKNGERGRGRPSDRESGTSDSKPSAEGELPVYREIKRSRVMSPAELVRFVSDCYDSPYNAPAAQDPTRPRAQANETTGDSLHLTRQEALAMQEEFGI